MEIVDNLAKHLDPKPIVIAERFIVKKCPVKVPNPESGKATWKPKPRSGKKKKKQQKVCLVEEDLTVKQSANGSDWPMFTVSDSRGKCL